MTRSVMYVSALAGNERYITNNPHSRRHFSYSFSSNIVVRVPQAKHASRRRNDHALRRVRADVEVHVAVLVAADETRHVADDERVYRHDADRVVNQIVDVRQHYRLVNLPVAGVEERLQLLDDV